jgi:hypothetical protein
MTIIHDLQEVFCLLGLKFCLAKIIKQNQIRFLETFK